MKYIWEETDIRPGRNLFLKWDDTRTCTIGKFSHPETHRHFVLIEHTGMVSVPYSAAELVHMFNENRSHPTS